MRTSPMGPRWQAPWRETGTASCFHRDRIAGYSALAASMRSAFGAAASWRLTDLFEHHQSRACQCSKYESLQRRWSPRPHSADHRPEFDPDRRTILYCAGGARSKHCSSWATPTLPTLRQLYRLDQASAAATIAPWSCWSPLAKLWNSGKAAVGRVLQPLVKHVSPASVD